jgi:hypothetical protein
MITNTKHLPRPERLSHWLFTTCGSWRNVLAFCLIAALTCISIRFNYELGKLNAVDDTSQDLLPIGYALLDMAGLFLSGYIGIRTVSLLRRWISWGWFLFLLSLSLWAAASFTLSVDSRLENAELTTEIETKKQSLQTQSQKVVIWQENLANTTRYKTRYSGILTQEQDKHAELARELAALKAMNTAPALAIYERVSPYLGMSTTLLLTIVKLAWAAALTLSPIVLMLLVAAEFGIIKKAQTNSTLDPAHGTRDRENIHPSWSDYGETHRQFSPYQSHPTTAHVAQKGAPEQVQSHASQPSISEEGAPEQVHPKHRTRKPHKMHSRAPSDQRDAGTNGKAGHRYQDLKQHIATQSSFRPSQRAIRQYCRCNQDVAIRYQQELLREGIIERQANGRYRVVNTEAKLRAVK